MNRLVIFVAAALLFGLGGCAGFYMAGDVGAHESHPHLLSTQDPP